MADGFIQDESYVYCRYCNSDEVARSRTRGAEGLLKWLFKRPYRCLVCGRRFFGSSRLRLKVEGKDYQWS